MDAVTATWLVGLLITGVLGFIGWIIKDKFTQIDQIDTRLVTVETKMNVLGDINTTLHLLRTDIEIIKVRMEPKP